jgi:RimJ/RimL family protein N-acetyltransferase
MPSPFEGQLIRLRAREPEDEADAYRWMADPDVILWNGVRYPRSRETMRERIEIGAALSYAHARFAVVTLAESRLIGDVAIHAEEPESRCAWLAMTIGDPEYRNRGYGTDALRTACRFGFNVMNLNRLELEVLADNERARKAYAKVGFLEEGRRRKAVFTHGAYRDLIVMGLLREELTGGC